MKRAAIAALAILGTHVARADDRAARADALFREGRALITQHDDAGACAKFAAANELDPDAAGTMLNLGLCNENLGKLKSALYWFRKAQLRAHETALPDYEQAAGEHTTTLAARVATVRIAFAHDAPPAGTRVTVDGEPIRAEDWTRVELDPGTHAIAAEAPAHARRVRELAIGNGHSSETLTFELEPLGDPARGRHRIALAVGAVGIALAATGIVVGVHARSAYRDCLAGAPMPPLTCGGEDGITFANHQADVARYAGTSLVAGGAIAIGVAAALWITAPRDRPAASVSVAASANGLAIVGTF